MTRPTRAGKGGRERMLEHEGVCMSMTAWAASIGIGYTTLSERLRSGWSVADALTTPLGKARDALLIEHKGERKTLQAWATTVGIPERVLKLRIRAGWPIELAIREPYGPNLPPRGRASNTNG